MRPVPRRFWFDPRIPPRRRRALGPAALALAIAAVAPLAARSAEAAPRDAAASRLRDVAIDEDYLATRFADAATALRRALALCTAAADCAEATRARLHGDLGVIDFALDRPDDGRTEFGEALAHDPGVTLDHGLATPALEREFERVRARRSAAALAVTDSQGTDCPPGFPGCDATPTATPAAAPESAPEPDAIAPEDAAAYKRSWISVGFEADALVLPSRSNACAGGTGYTCFDGGSYYAAQPLAGADDVVDGGIRLATMRVLVGYDRAVLRNVTVGGSLGYAFGGGPQRPGASSFLPVHVEVRGSYWLGHAPLGRTGVRPFVAASAGMAEVDASVPADVYASVGAYEAGQSHTVDAWRKTGLGFAALGLGAMYAFTPGSGVVLEAKGVQSFPTGGTGFALQLGYAVGL